MTKVKNLNGTTNRTPPAGYSTWKEWWETKTGRKFSTCSCSGCQSSASVGAHVQKASSTDYKWYIVPLCRACNGKASTEIFEVRDADFVAING